SISTAPGPRKSAAASRSRNCAFMLFLSSKQIGFELLISAGSPSAAALQIRKSMTCVMPSLPQHPGGPSWPYTTLLELFDNSRPRHLRLDGDALLHAEGLQRLVQGRGVQVRISVHGTFRQQSGGKRRQRFAGKPYRLAFQIGICSFEFRNSPLQVVFVFPGLSGCIGEFFFDSRYDAIHLGVERLLL